MLLAEENERESKEGGKGMEDGRGCLGEGRELIAVPDIFLQQACLLMRPLGCTHLVLLLWVLANACAVHDTPRFLDRHA